MKRFLTLAAMGAALLVAACDRPEPTDEGLEPSPPIDVAPPVAEPEPVPPPTTTPSAPATDTTTLPEDKRSSEETVQPDSPTLFY